MIKERTDAEADYKPVDNEALAQARQDAQGERFRLQAAKDRVSLRRLEMYEQHLNKHLRPSKNRKGGWSVPGGAERDMPKGDRDKGLAMSRQKAEETPMAIGIITTLTDQIVGAGFRLSMRTPNKTWNKRLETWWRTEKDRLDIRNMRPWGRMQRCWFMRSRLDGDVGLNLTDEAKVETIEAERIKGNDGMRTRDGVEFDEYGRALNYLVVPPIMPGQEITTEEPKPLDAENFILYAHFPHERANRLRGVPALLQCLNHIEDLEETISGIIQKVQNEAFLGIKFKKDFVPDGTLFGPEVDSLEDDDEGTRRRQVKLVKNLNLEMEPHEDAEIMESKSPPTNVIEFLRFYIRYIGLGHGLPLEMLLLDFSDTNYSGGRALLELAKRRFMVEQEDLAYVSSKVFQWRAALAIAKGELKPPRALRQKEWWAHGWITPVCPYLDPLKETTAQVMQLQNHLTTHEGILGQTTDMDFDDLVEKRKAELEAFKKAGIPISLAAPGTPMNSPDDETGKKEEE